MKIGYLSVDDDSDGKVHLSKEFLAMHALDRADFLQDIIIELKRYYNDAAEQLTPEYFLDNRE